MVGDPWPVLRLPPAPAVHVPQSLDQRTDLSGQLMNWLIMGQNYHLVHHLWPSIPWFEYKPAYEATKPLLDAKGSPQRLGIF